LRIQATETAREAAAACKQPGVSEEPDAASTMSLVKPAPGAAENPRTVSGTVSPDERTLVEVQKVIGRLRRLWEGRGAMFEALAQEQEPEGGGADGVLLHHQKFWKSLHRTKFPL